jgi:hypothetical protein
MAPSRRWWNTTADLIRQHLAVPDHAMVAGPGVGVVAGLASNTAAKPAVVAFGVLGWLAGAIRAIRRASVGRDE